MALKNGGIQIRLTSAERNRLEEVANRKGISLSELVRVAIQESVFSPDSHVEAVQRLVYEKTPESLRTAIESMSMLGSSLGYHVDSLDLVDFFDVYSQNSKIELREFDSYREYFADNLTWTKHGDVVDAACQFVADKFRDLNVPAKEVLSLLSSLYRQHWRSFYNSSYMYRNIEVASRYMIFSGTSADLNTIFVAAKRATNALACYAATHDTAAKNL